MKLKKLLLKKLKLVGRLPAIPATQEMEAAGSWFQTNLGKSQRPYQKEAEAKRGGGIAQEEHLLSMLKALSSIPSTGGKKTFIISF
jgi:hypothetical protein